MALSTPPRYYTAGQGEIIAKCCSISQALTLHMTQSDPILQRIPRVPVREGNSASVREEKGSSELVLKSAFPSQCCCLEHCTFFSRLYPTLLSTQQLVDASHFAAVRQKEEDEHILDCISREVGLSQQSWSLWDRFPCILAVCFLSLFCSVLPQPSPVTACCVCSVTHSPLLL